MKKAVVFIADGTEEIEVITLASPVCQKILL